MSDTATATNLDNDAHAHGPISKWVLLVALIGVALRGLLFLRARPLWLDEAMLAIGIVGKPLNEVLGTLDYNQVAPIGWLTLEWLSVQLLGSSELALRLVPLLLGLAAIPFFFLAARRLLSPTGALIALLLFCISEPLVYYSAEVKPYSADIFAATLMLWLSLRILQDGFKTKDLVALGIAGIVMITLSFTSLFIMAGLLATLFVCRLRGPRRDLLVIVGVGVVYLAVFGWYFLNFLQLESESDLIDNMQASGRLAPMPPTSVKDVEWYLDALFNYFVDPMGFKAMGLAMLATAIGVVTVAKRNRWLVALLVAPLLVGLVASMLKRYPFVTFDQYEHPLRGRYIMYSTPVILLLVAAGMTWLWHAVRLQRRWLGIVLLAALLWHPFYRTAYDIKLHPHVGDIRSVMQQLQKHVQPGDVVFTSWFAEPPYRFYRSRFDLETVETFSGDRPIVRKSIMLDAWSRIDDWKQTEALFAPYANRRVWLVFIHHPSSFGYADEKNLLNHLDDRGERLMRYPAHNASLTLYQLSEH